MIAPALEQKVAELELRLGEAFDRIAQLERQGSLIRSAESNAGIEQRQLLPQDSPEMTYALQLVSEMFPGSTTKVEIEYDPSEPHWKWYSFNVQWAGEVRDSIDRQMEWHDRLAKAFPHLSDQFRMFVDLQ